MSSVATKPVSKPADPFAGVPVCNRMLQAFDSPARASVRPDGRVLPLQLPRETGWKPYRPSEIRLGCRKATVISAKAMRALEAKASGAPVW